MKSLPWPITIHTPAINFRSFRTRTQQDGTCCSSGFPSIIILELVMVLGGGITMDWTAVGKRIRAARERAGYTQEELAAELGMSPTHSSVLERGVKPPKLETFVRIATALHSSSPHYSFHRSWISRRPLQDRPFH